MFQLIAVFLLGNQDTPEAVVDFPLWEIAAYKYSNRYNLGFYNNDSQVQLLVFGTAVLDMEINNANRKLAPYFGGGGTLLSFALPELLLKFRGFPSKLVGSDARKKLVSMNDLCAESNSSKRIEFDNTE
ncbi:unnamed protein product [Heligmosomoides polygyrus]|uniref:Peptidase A1 domain-containing protein n=1 Tax=Heligmosomoides polygyrus TaxID=6339 RepID=A0A183FV99_HELPZ|nr:unnamed protein product [Heligmosomoides polygyrus]